MGVPDALAGHRARTGAAGGAQVWLTAQYFNTRKETGPLAQPIFTHLPGGGVVMPSLMLAA
jgi:hypothetical protein